MTTLAPHQQHIRGLKKKTSEILRFVTLPLEIPDKINLQNPRPNETSHYFFLITAENSKQNSFN